MKFYADLHLHTDCSDGVLTPEELVERASMIKGVSAISITDHDTFDGIDRAISFPRRSVEIVPGIELSTDVDGKELHILGFYVDYKTSPLVAKISEFKNARIERAKKIVSNLNGMNVNINYEDVLKIAGYGAIGRPHIARAIVNAGVVENSWEAFDRYLGDDSPAYEPKLKISPVEAVRLIKSSGGIAIWAHPKTLSVTDLINELVNAGLDGLESYHPKHTEEDSSFLLNVVKQYGLISTGGSDFHDDERGKDIGDCGISCELFQEFKKRANKLDVRI